MELFFIGIGLALSFASRCLWIFKASELNPIAISRGDLIITIKSENSELI